MTVDELVARLEKVKRQGKGWVARCPAHPDKEPSLSIGEGDDGRILLKCHAGCTTGAIVAALNLTLADLMGKDKVDPLPEPQAHEPVDWEIVAAYDYRDPDGNLAFQVLRMEAARPDGTRRKTFRQRRPDPSRPGDWIWSMEGQTLYPYMLPEIRSAIELEPATPIWVCEGEKDVHSLLQGGQVATTNPGGAGKWKDEYSTMLAGMGVYRCRVVCDTDEPGRAHGTSVVRSLRNVGITTELYEPAVGKDVTDHLEAGKTIQELVPHVPNTSWVAVNLANVNENEPPPTLILRCIYPNMRHLVYGEPESLKSWFAVSALAEVLKTGRYGMYVDYEMSARVMKRRLRAIGLTDEQLARVIYVKPDAALDQAGKDHLNDLFRMYDIAIVVIDAATGALASNLLDDNSNIDVEKWIQEYVNFFWGKEERAVVVIDHVTKNADTRGDWSAGSKRKKEGFDVSLSFKMVKRLGRAPGQDGKAEIKAHKDRHAWLTPYPRVADFHMDVTDEGRIVYRCVEPVVPKDKDGNWMPTYLMEQVSKHLELGVYSDGLSMNVIERDVKGGSGDLRKAVTRLVEHGHLEHRGSGSTSRYAVVKPYRQPPPETENPPTSSPSSPLVSTSSKTRATSPSSPSSPPLLERGTRDEGVGRENKGPLVPRDEAYDLFSEYGRFLQEED